MRMISPRDVIPRALSETTHIGSAAQITCESMAERDVLEGLRENLGLITARLVQLRVQLTLNDTQLVLFSFPMPDDIHVHRAH